MKRKLLAGIAVARRHADEARAVYSAGGLLQSLGIAHGTDKYNIEHTFDNRSYLDVYEQYFSEYRLKPLTLVEIGVKNGASLRMWKSYFPNAEVIGIDIDPSCEVHAEERIRILIGSQDDPRVLEEVLAMCDGGPDIVIDDGSHINAHVITTFTHLFPHVRPNGMYAIEDLGSSYDDLSHPRHPEYRRTLNPGANLKNDRRDLDRMFQQILHDMDHGAGSAGWCHFWPRMCIVGRTRQHAAL